MAISVTTDVISYCVTKGSPVFACSLDAEGAFDAIPHGIILKKSIAIIPDVCWRLLYYWYTHLTVQVRWNGKLSDSIRVLRGTRQGGLSSPFLFNIFYQDMITELSESIGGITINGVSYNVFCYADDILLTNTSTTGLQRLINVADLYIVSHGQKFNPMKTQCITFGKTHFVDSPKWILNDTILTELTEISYLGATLSNNSYNHVNTRIKSCRKAFYAMQSVGICKDGLSPATSAHICKVAIQPIHTYAT